MTTRQYDRAELMEHLKGAAENGRPSPMQLVCAEAYDEIERLRAALDEIHILAGRQGPPDNIEALNKIEAVAAAAILNQQRMTK